MNINYSVLAKSIMNLGYCRDCAYAITTRYPIFKLCDNCKNRLEINKKIIKIMENSKWITTYM